MMAETTGIEWCDHTFNAWIGCTKVSVACDFCYAETYGHRFGVEWGAHERRRTSESYWLEPLKWNRKAERDGVRRKVFCCSLADVFDNQVNAAWRDDLWRLIYGTPHLDWLLLTKRPQNIAKMLPHHTGRTWPWANVWLGTTVENQEEADRRIPHLLAVPAPVHFLSCEPLLGPVDLRFGEAIRRKAHPRLDWVIAGGESGLGARPPMIGWIRSLRDQCQSVGVPFFFKQWGEYMPDDPSAAHTAMRRVGKKAAGSLLDGQTHRAFPA